LDSLRRLSLFWTDTLHLLLSPHQSKCIFYHYLSPV
jgi:hypothetical protein